MNIEEIPWWVTDEAARQAGELNAAYADRNRLEKRIEDLEGICGRLKGALSKCGHHSSYCARRINGCDGSTNPYYVELNDCACTCGLDEALAIEIPKLKPTSQQIDQAVKQLDQMAAKRFAEKNNQPPNE